MGDVLNFMSKLARKAGKLQAEDLGQRHKIEFKGVINIVTEVDKRCEELIVGEIQRKFPGDDILAEEGGGLRTKSDRRWVIDPLDGTVNYAHDFPFFCVSIALEVAGDLVAGVIYDPNRDELYAAEKGMGASLNGGPISVSKNSPLRKSMLATGFAYNEQEGEERSNLVYFAKFIKTAQAVRRPGSAAIDMAYVACGRLDGFWELFLRPWDMAAGVVIMREAGALVTAFDGSPFDLYADEILASNGLIHDEMMAVLRGTHA
jgi:myo-inositol-1(or 4)-monophosphatase